MKKLWLTAIVASLMVTGAQAKQWKEVRVAIEGAYPPFSSVDEKGQLHGFDVDITNALCEQMKVKCTIVKQDWDGMIPGLLARKFDAIISTMDITEERKKRIDFSGKYQHVPAHFAAKKGATIELTQAFMKDKKIAVQRATSMDTYVSDNFPDTEIKRYGSYDEAYLDLKSGRVDYVLADTASVMDGLVNKSNGEYSLVGPGLSDKKWFGEGAGVALRKGDGDLKAMFNKAILDIRANGKYKQINDKYFDFDVYGE
ncbi:extracellular solute-binding protein family 3 [Tolumonas auensis DSM 9187]|uniref:Extracellular solute-binding protein family 3 n=1 Tax=Tolumonas auensis (strain DSM 9187 / NBRC 110442 / TA 4) TaxID=595494 RepID=C4LC48_TOLAT|nr:ABC transporter substrate-binding protein [Tolumonas auensis]ACQ92527.1 extracellular solute-binding protein family 3 [Tolumonas auensis DSM 9187]